MSLSLEQYKELQKMIDPISLHAYGLQRNTPKIVLFYTTEQTGLGIQHLYRIQGIEKLKLFIMHIRRNDTTGIYPWEILNLNWVYDHFL